MSALFTVAYVMTVIAALSTMAMVAWIVVRMFAMMDDIRYLRQVREQHEETGEEELPELVVNQRTPAFPFVMVAVILICVAALLWSLVAWDGMSQVAHAFTG